MKYLIMQIGCIECGVSSYPIATTDSLDKAMEVAKGHPSTWDSEGGEGYISIIDLDQCKEVEIVPCYQ